MVEHWLLLTVTVYVPDWLIWSKGPMVQSLEVNKSGPSHEQLLPPDAVREIPGPPKQRNDGPDIEHVGAAVTVTVFEQELVHPSAEVTVTVYDVVELGETVMDALVAPVLHK